MDSSLKYRAVVVREEAGTFKKAIETLSLTDLTARDILVRVAYTGLNYKDGLSAAGHKGVTRKYPHTPGIDAAGTVVESKHPDFKPGAQVIVTSYDLGMNTFGGFGQYISVPAAWVVPKPENLTLRESMILGTAALTAAIGIEKMLTMGQDPAAGSVVVSGATGGVGSLAVLILSALGFEVEAVTGKSEAHSYLQTLGAKTIRDRTYIDDQSGKLLLKPKWAGAFDTVGNNVLATLIKGCQKSGNIAACGNVAGFKLPTTVLPFILNGVNLLGINSADHPMSSRLRLWAKLATDWKPTNLDEVAIDVPLEACLPYFEAILKGEIRGRVVVDLT